MEQKLILILEKITTMEMMIENINSMLDDRYKFKNDETSINAYLEDIDKQSLIGVNCNMIYEAYKLTTSRPASKRKLHGAIKSRFNLKTKHTTKNNKNIYYWSE